MFNYNKAVCRRAGGPTDQYTAGPPHGSPEKLDLVKYRTPLKYSFMTAKRGSKNINAKGQSL